MANITIACGFFDPPSGYQEVVLAQELARNHNVRVVTSDHSSPVYSETARTNLGIPLRYEVGRVNSGNLEIVRVKSIRRGAIVMPLRARLPIDSQNTDALILTGVGQLFSPFALRSTVTVPIAAIFGDNSAQWGQMSPLRRRIKSVAFHLSKGRVYERVINDSTIVYGNTPETVERLAPYSSGKTMEYLPLPVDGSTYRPNESARTIARRELGLHDQEVLISLVGKPTPEKNWELALECVKHLGSDPPWRLLISGLGEDDYSDRLRQLVAQDSILSRRALLTEFMPASSLASVLNASDVCVWPKNPAITIQQAMASGSQVIIPAGGLTGHLVEHPIQGRTVQGSSPLMWADALRRQMLFERTPQSREDISARASMLDKTQIASRISSDLGLGD